MRATLANGTKSGAHGFKSSDFGTNNCIDCFSDADPDQAKISKRRNKRLFETKNCSKGDLC